MYLGNEYYEDCDILNFPTPVNTGGNKRKRMAPVEEIKCEPTHPLQPSLTNNNNQQCLLSNSSTNSSMNNENTRQVFWKRFINLFRFSFDDYDEMNNPHPQKLIKFAPYQKEMWPRLYDGYQNPLNPPVLSIVADKGFIYSTSDGCFISQKKNHMQITVLVNPTNQNVPKFVFTNEQGLKVSIKGRK
jgi:hypothetical protein